LDRLVNTTDPGAPGPALDHLNAREEHMGTVTIKNDVVTGTVVVIKKEDVGAVCVEDGGSPIVLIPIAIAMTIATLLTAGNQMQFCTSQFTHVSFSFFRDW
jgi:hypothetical protein